MKLYVIECQSNYAILNKQQGKKERVSMGRREGGLDRSKSKDTDDARTWEVEEKNEKKKRKRKNKQWSSNRM